MKSRCTESARFAIALPDHLDESTPDSLDVAVKEKIKQRLREVKR